MPKDFASQIWEDDSSLPRGPQSLGQIIRYYRERNNWSQQDLGDRLKPRVDQSNISKWEADTQGPRRGRLIEMARLFGISADELYNASGFTHGGKVFNFDRRYLDAYDTVDRLGDKEVLSLFVRIVVALASLLKLVSRNSSKTP